MPLILPGNVASATADAGYTVDNSCRFNTTSSDDLVFTQSGGNRKTFTLSFWVKKSTLGAGQMICVAQNAGHYCYFYFHTDDTLHYYDIDGATQTIDYRTNRVFRDVSAWYHIVFRVDTTQSTAGDRIRFYINGVQETSFSLSLTPSQDTDLEMNVSGHTFRFGNYNSSSSWFGGYLAECVFIDGLSLAPTSFGEFDEDSPTIWKPIDVSELTFGTNGVYLTYSDSADLGADSSGNSNDFTVSNLAAADQATDTPTNNFATFNPLNPEGTITYSEGNLKANNSADASYRVAHSTFAVNNGKWYAEFKADNMASSIDSNVGIISADQIVYSTSSKNTDTYIGSWSYGANGRVSKYNADAQTSQTTYTTGDIIGVALDIDNGYLYFAKNNTWQNSGDPTSGATGTGGYALANQTDLYYFVVSTINSGGEHRWLANFGSPSYANSSDAADADGYGAFEYAPPSGFFSLCSANLAEYG